MLEPQAIHRSALIFDSSVLSTIIYFQLFSLIIMPSSIPCPNHLDIHVLYRHGPVCSFLIPAMQLFCSPPWTRSPAEQERRVSGHWCILGSMDGRDRRLMTPVRAS
jgi:hypothetical protein